MMRISKRHTSASSAPRSAFLDQLDAVKAKGFSDKVNLKEIFDTFGDDGHFLLILFMIMPFLQPIPLVGLSTPFGILIAMAAAKALFGRPPWLPKRWAERPITMTTVTKILGGAEWIHLKIGGLFRRRLALFLRGGFRVVNVLLIILNGMILALPLPIPFSNTFPAWAIGFVTIGILEKDGLFVLLSYVQALLCLGYFVMLGVGAAQLPSLLQRF